MNLLNSLNPKVKTYVVNLINLIMNTNSLTDDAVRDAAKDLVTRNGKTTTLEIKQELRKKGYFAVQDDVSAIMDNEYSNIGMDFVVQSGHRVYSFINTTRSTTNTNPTTSLGGLSVSTLGVPASNQTRSTSGNTVKPPVTKKKGKYSYKNINKIDAFSTVKGDWKVSTSSGTIIYYKGDVPRYTARYAYSKETGTPYKSVRARRVKG